MDKSNFAVLMAGGIGSRFWPVSTTKKPKQFRDLLGAGETLIQTTYKRLCKVVPAKNILILSNVQYKNLIQEQLPEVKEDRIVLEPTMRNTAPAVLLAALKIKKICKDAVMVMAPSDHWIENESAFVQDIEMAFEACRGTDKILTLGIKPTFPNTGFGYIQYREGDQKIKEVQKFTEKPNFEQARNFIAADNYLWNAGIFVWDLDFILNSFRRNLPETFHLLSSGNEVFNTSEEASFLKEAYPKAENTSIDYAILEKENNISVIVATFYWNDLGTWGSLYDEVEKDVDENVVLNARLSAEDSSGNIISSDSNRVMVLNGLRDFIIVDEKGVLIVVPKEKEQEIKNIRSNVMKKFGNDLG